MAYLIWSNEHNAWWKYNGRGYTTDLGDAGLYEEDEAMEILTASATGAPPGQPKEILCEHPSGLTYYLELNRDEKGEPIIHVDTRSGTHRRR